MSVTRHIRTAVTKALQDIYQQPFTEKDFQVNQTKPEFEGDYTVVLFALVKQLKKSPDAIGSELGQQLVDGNPGLFSSFNLIKGFLNLSVANAYWTGFLSRHSNDERFGIQPASGRRVMIEYSSPNTNKPLHLGHLRNNFLGWSVAEIYKHNGAEVSKTCIVNDRGIHICKSMIAWQLFANGATPESTGTKGDHFVGDYYVKFNDELKDQSKPLINDIYEQGDLSLFTEDEQLKINTHLKKINELQPVLEKAIGQLDIKAIEKFGTAASTLAQSALSKQKKWKDVLKSFDEEEYKNIDPKEKEDKQKQLQKILKPVLAIEEKITEEDDAIKDLAENKTAIMQGAKQMLVDWEAGKPEVIDLWKRMNNWVYAGFDETYKRIGSDFQKIYYESNTYLLGKKYVEEGLLKGIFYKKEDGSVWVDLTRDGLDEKILQRRDGTSVYITQDIGLADVKQAEFHADQSIYVIGDEQNYHMQVLKLIAKKLGISNAEGIHHLSYGMVELPTGKMKSREGTVVDADDLLNEMYDIAAKHTQELGKVKDFEEDELKDLYNTISLGALKFFLMRVDPKKRMVFNPEESIDFHGFTGPFVQYTHARIKSILRKEQPQHEIITGDLLPLEKTLLLLLEQFPSTTEQAEQEMNPSVLAVYVFNLAKTFNSFYTEHSIINAESSAKKELRLQIAQLTAHVIKLSMGMLGIKVPERM
ncbi:MAG: arginine--tRNA ligase [Chitinophagaceae bacterium]